MRSSSGLLLACVQGIDQRRQSERSDVQLQRGHLKYCSPEGCPQTALPVELINLKHWSCELVCKVESVNIIAGNGFGKDPTMNTGRQWWLTSLALRFCFMKLVSGRPRYWEARCLASRNRQPQPFTTTAATSFRPLSTYFILY